MGDARLWVGERKNSGSLWVFDPDIEHEDESMVFAFWVSPGRMKEYSKQQLKSILRPVDDTRRQTAIDAYLKWKAINGATFLAEERIRAPQRREEARARQQKQHNELLARHRAYLEEHGKNYEGVTEGVARRHRSTHCYRCKQPLDSTLHIECNTCNWMICYCGACGCGYAL